VGLGLDTFLITRLIVHDVTASGVVAGTLVAVLLGLCSSCRACGKGWRLMSSSTPGRRDSEAADRLAGSRVLVVEDEFILAWEIERELYAAGCASVKLVTLATEALRELRYWRPDVVLLDLRLRDGLSSLPIADTLDDRKVPFVILTGQTPDAVSERHRSRPFLHKPCPTEIVLKTLRRALED
jgi:CheY-like chemotaxis protein